MASNDESFNINSLPVEMLLKIFSYLSHNELRHIARVCKRWNELTKSSVFWKEVYVKFDCSHKSQTSVTMRFVKMLPPCVARISLDFGYSFTWSDPLNFEELCLKLEKRCPHLEMLIVKGAMIPDSIAVVIDLCTLLLQNVKILIIRCSKFASPAPRDAFGGTSKIEVLDISRCNLGTSPIPPFSRMPHLVQFLAHDSTCHSDDLFKSGFSFVNQLHELDLGGAGVRSRTFQGIRDHALNLKVLCICSARVKDDDFNFNNMSVFPHLKTICLRYCRHVTCVAVVSLVQSCRSLQNVYVKQLVAGSYVIHPFVVANTSKLEIVKVVSDCNSHRTENHLCY